MAIDVAADESDRLHVTVCYAQSQRVWMRDLIVPAGASAAQAVAASGFCAAFPDVDPMQYGLAVYGQAVAPEHVLCEGDRVEILRPLVFDPKESRRRRAEHRQQAGVARQGL